MCRFAIETAITVVALAFMGCRESAQVPRTGSSSQDRAATSSKAKTTDPTTIEVEDVDGRMQTPLAATDRKATLLLFLLTDCPISNGYAPEIQRICAEYSPKGIAAFIVHADPDVSASQAKKHAADYGLTCPVLLDPEHKLVKVAGVTTAPEVAVLDADGKVVYRGRIDDRYVDFGKSRPEPRQRDLRNALDAVLEGKPVLVPLTEVIGCHLPEGRNSGSEPLER
jgi:hypothetical protein